MTSLNIEHESAGIKGSLTRDFRSQFFFHESVSPGPLSNPLGSFRLFSKIRRDNRE
jgi:hypothetical protein